MAFVSRTYDPRHTPRANLDILRPKIEFSLLVCPLRLWPIGTADVAEMMSGSLGKTAANRE